MLSPHPRISPFVTSRAHRRSAGLEVPLVDPAGEVRLIIFELGAAELVRLAADATAAATAILQQEAHENAISAASSLSQVPEKTLEGLDLGINLKKV